MTIMNRNVKHLNMPYDNTCCRDLASRLPHFMDFHSSEERNNTNIALLFSPLSDKLDLMFWLLPTSDVVCGGSFFRNAKSLVAIMSTNSPYHCLPRSVSYLCSYQFDPKPLSICSNQVFEKPNIYVSGKAIWTVHQETIASCYAW
jgi:hypothetical protein